MRKLFLILVLLFSGLSYGQASRHPVFPDNETFPEKGSVVPIVLVTVLSSAILILIVLIIRKATQHGRRTIIDGFDSRRFGKGYIMHSLFRESSSKYSKRRDRNKGLGSGIGIGGFGGGW